MLQKQILDPEILRSLLYQKLIFVAKNLNVCKTKSCKNPICNLIQNAILFTRIFAKDRSPIKMCP